MSWKDEYTINFIKAIREIENELNESFFINIESLSGLEYFGLIDYFKKIHLGLQYVNSKYK